MTNGKDIDNDLMEDFMEKGWERKSKDSKMITLSKKFQKRPDEEKITYLWKLASSLNHVAVQIQKERDEANSLLFVKEEKLVKCHEGRSQEQVMIRKQLEIADGKYQELLTENQNLYAEIKELKSD